MRMWRSSTPIDWASESFEISTSPAVEYCVHTEAGCRYAAGNERLDPGEPEKLVVVDRRYIETHTAIVRDRLVEAGVRLGWLLTRRLVTESSAPESARYRGPLQLIALYPAEDRDRSLFHCDEPCDMEMPASRGKPWKSLSQAVAT